MQAPPKTSAISSPERFVVRHTASSILAKLLPNQRTQHKMDAAAHALREKAQVSYAESDGSGDSPMPATPVNTSRPDIQLGDEIMFGEDDEIMYADGTYPVGHSLRLRHTRSLKASGNGDGKPAVGSSSKRPSRKRVTALSFYGHNDFDMTPVVSDRLAVRHEIASVTAAKRNRFFVEKKDYFLPLLPEAHNYVKKLVEKQAAKSDEEKASEPATFPYEEIEVQPRGIQATMKPYQLSGLSFMVYLHRNGLSGILGDEMGLGKTLQTLSLIQYLKENEPNTGRQLRPFLIIAPLSVLSSWMAESKKWAPGLKALRFHGPIKERDRLKKIAVGEIDMMGNLTNKYKNKLKGKRNAAGKPIISLDSDSDNEEEEVGVDLIVTTYECYLSEQGWFKRAFVWRYVVLDEGHKVKNDMSLISKALQGLQAEYRLILTGTPLQNNLAELWALLHWLYQDVFTDQSSDLFRTSFDLGKGLFSSTVLDRSRHLLELIMLRRMKNSPGVDLNLPPKTEVLLYVPLSPMQRFWYTRLITRADQGLLDELFKGAKTKEEFALKNEDNAEEKLIQKDAEALEQLTQDMEIGSDQWKESREILARQIQREQEGENEEGAVRNSAWQKLMNLLMQLRKVCNHPYQIPNAEPHPWQVGDHIITASGKFIILDKLIKELVIKQRKKILIFSGFTRMLDLVEDFLSICGGDGSSYRFVRLDGRTARARRNLGIRMFNDVNTDYRIMLISTRAGGLGINLATASDVVLLDQDWNPQITLQAESRAHRIGQTQPVTIYKLVSQGTVEEQMMGRIQKKLYLSAKVTESMQDIHTKQRKLKKGPGGRVVEAEDDMPQLDTNQLMALVRRGASAISRPDIDINDMLSWDWETTVLKCKDQPADINVKKDMAPEAVIDAEAEKKWLSEMERVESSIFEGKSLARQKRGGASTKDIAGDWKDQMSREERRIGKNVTVMVDGFAISKESMLCNDWEAVPTMAGRDPSLAEPKRLKKPKVNSQSHCQVCLDGGEINCCKLCPRAYHFTCLNREFKSKANGWQFNCPQHQCFECEQKTTDAGGMLYRCRWCERAFCEDCLNFEKSVLLGDNLKEYELLQYPVMTQAFYIECHVCIDHFAEAPRDKALCDSMATETEREHKKVFGAADTISLAGSLTDATTVETTGANTPIVIDDDFEVPAKKRKLQSIDSKKITFKRKKLEAPEKGKLKLSFKRENSSLSNSHSHPFFKGA